MTGRKRTLFFLVLFLATSAHGAENVAPVAAVGAGGENAGKIAGEVRKRYEKVKSLSARFVQENFLMTLGRTDVSRGSVYFKKPGMMRWDYTEPETDAVVSDGTTVWVYEAALAQVIETPVRDGAAAIAMEFLSGTGDLTKDFSVTIIESREAREEGPETYLLSLTPRTPIETVTAITIEVEKGTRLIVKSVMEDRFGGRTTISLEDIVLNPALDDSLFRFVVPEGVRVLRP
jgi:outer membrane lipoprotein carrier protein